MIWVRSHRFDKRVLPLADRHYNRRKIGSPQFVPPGSNIVLLTPEADALWVTSAPIAAYVRHAWAGAWVCTLFRNEGPNKASELIRQAVAASLAHYGKPPELGMVTFINRRFVRPYVTPKGRVIYGQTYRQAGFKEVGETKGGLLAFQLLPSDMPPACEAPGAHA